MDTTAIGPTTPTEMAQSTDANLQLPDSQGESQPSVSASKNAHSGKQGYFALAAAVSGWLVFPLIGGVIGVILGTITLARSGSKGFTANLPGWLGVILGLLNLITPFCLLATGLGFTLLCSLCGSIAGIQ